MTHVFGNRETHPLPHGGTDLLLSTFAHTLAEVGGRGFILKKFVIATALMIGAFTNSFAQQANSTTLSEADFARFTALRRSGVEALYNLDYEKARQDFQEIVRLYPNHPGGPQLLAARVWAKTLYESRRLQSSLYNKESFYASGDDK
ncbi:MAG TPA: hypothetical protein VI750_08925, partial [Pyrinomonadaceae bacterium]|nr:hypothetical protein [Pyrinomonadaceae bacterium]